MSKLRIIESTFKTPLTLTEWIREFNFGARYDDQENKGLNDHIAYMKRLYKEKSINNQNQKKR